MGLPEALRVGENHFDIAAEFPEELPAGAARRKTAHLVP